MLNFLDFIIIPHKSECLYTLCRCVASVFILNLRHIYIILNIDVVRSCFVFVITLIATIVLPGPDRNFLK